MPFTPTAWQDFPSTATPITAAQLNRMETGIDQATDTAEAAVPKSTVTTKGDLIAGTASATVARRGIGANGTVLMANSAEATGMEWTSDLPVAALAPGTEGQVLKTTSGIPAWGTSSDSVPTGAIFAYGGSVAPTGYVLGDGSAVSRTGQAALFALYGTTFGAGDGSTTFNLPDLRGRIPVGKGTNASVDTLGESDGVAVGNRRPQHRHTPHSHTINQLGVNSGSQLQNGSPTTTAPFIQTISSADGGSGVATDSLDAPAYLVLNYIIKT